MKSRVTYCTRKDCDASCGINWVEKWPRLKQSDRCLVPLKTYLGPGTSQTRLREMNWWIPTSPTPKPARELFLRGYTRRDCPNFQRADFLKSQVSSYPSMCILRSGRNWTICAAPSGLI